MPNIYKNQRIFVSSTFLDMQKERDYLKKKILPIIKEYALKYYINVEFVDLRFGIDIGNKNSLKKVVDVCVEEIDSCTPLFLCFLGNRYGTKVEKENRSITEIEIEYALSSGFECAFFFRNIKNSNEMPKEEIDKYYNNEEEFKRIKSVLKERYSDKCFSYEAQYVLDRKELEIEDYYLESIIKQIQDMIDHNFKENDNVNVLTPYFDYVSYLNNEYIDVNKVSLDDIFSSHEKVILLYGEPGSGKSMQISNFINNCQYKIIPYNAIINEEKSGLKHMLNTFLNYFNSDKENDDITFLIDEFYKTLAKQQEKIVFVIDGYENIDENRSSWIRIENIPENIRFVLVSNNKEHLSVFKYDAKIIEIEKDLSKSIKEIVENYLTKKNIKMNAYVLKEIIKTFETQMGNVSFLQLATSLDYLFYNDRQDASLIAEFSSKEKDDENMTALDKGVLKFYLDKIHTVPAFFDELLGLLIDKKSEMCNKEFVKVIFSALCVSSKGLNEEDIKKILEDRFDTPYANAEFSYLRKCFKGYFSQLANGNFVIGNSKIKDAIYKYYSKEEDFKKVIASICELKLNKDEDDEDKYDSLLYLLYEIDEKELILNLLSTTLYFKKEYPFFMKDLLKIYLKDKEYFIEIVKHNINPYFNIYLANDFVFSLVKEGKDEDIEFFKNVFDKCLFKDSINYLRCCYDYALMNKNNNYENIDKVKESFDAYLKSSPKPLEIQYPIISAFYIEYTRFGIDKDFELKQLVDSLNNANYIIKLVPEKRRTKAWTHLIEIYLLFSEIYAKANKFECVSPYIEKAYEILNSYNVDSLAMDKMIETLLTLTKGYLLKEDENKVVLLNNYLKSVSLKFREENKSLLSIKNYYESLYISLLVKEKYDQINILPELITLYNKMNELFTKTNSMAIKAVLANAYQKILEIKKVDFEIIRKNYNAIIALKRDAFVHENIECVNELLNSQVWFMRNAHIRLDQDKTLHEKNNRIYKIFYDYVKARIKYIGSFEFKTHARDIYFYYALSIANDKNLKESLLKEVVEMSYEINNEVRSSYSLMCLANDTYFLLDVLRINSKDHEAVSYLDSLKECLNFFIQKNGIKDLTFYEAKTNIYLLMYYAKEDKIYDIDIVSYLNSILLHEGDKSYLINMTYFMMIEILEDLKTKDYKALKQAYNDFYDYLYPTYSDFLAQQGHKKFEIVKEVKKKENLLQELMERIEKEDIKEGFNQEALEGFDMDEVNKLIEESEKFRQKELEVYEKEIKHLDKQTQLENAYDQSLEKGEDEEAYWKKQISLGYDVGHYYLGKYYSKLGKDEEAHKEYERGYKKGEAISTYYYSFKFADEKNYDAVYNLLKESALKGFYHPVTVLIKSFRDYLANDEGIYEKLLETCHQNIGMNALESANQQVLDYASKLIELGNIDIEKLDWFLKFYEPTEFEETEHGVYSRRKYISKSYEKEYKLFLIKKKAVIEKDLDSIIYLAYSYYHGDEMNADFSKALYWAEVALENGESRYMLNIIEDLYFGYNTYEIDRDKAYELAQKVLNGKDEKYKDRVKGFIEFYYKEKK